MNKPLAIIFVMLMIILLIIGIIFNKIKTKSNKPITTYIFPSNLSSIVYTDVNDFYIYPISEDKRYELFFLNDENGYLLETRIVDGKVHREIIFGGKANDCIHKLSDIIN